MISEKDYLKLIKKLPYHYIPDNLSQMVLDKCNPFITKRQKKVSNSVTYINKYVFASLIVLTLILFMGLNNNYNKEQHQFRLATNTKLFAHQLAQSANIVFTGQTGNERRFLK